MKAWQIIRERKLDKALILEDDVVLGTEFPKIAAELCALPVAWDIIRLGVFMECGKMKLSRNRTVLGAIPSREIALRSVMFPNVTGAMGYFLTYSGSQKLLKRFDNRKIALLPLDSELNIGWRFSENLLQLYYTEKCILHNGYYSSQIKISPTQKAPKTHKKWEKMKQRIKREKYRLLLPNIDKPIFMIWVVLSSVRLFLNAWLWRIRINWLGQYRREKNGW